MKRFLVSLLFATLIAVPALAQNVQTQSMKMGTVQEMENPDLDIPNPTPAPSDPPQVISTEGDFEVIGVATDCQLNENQVRAATFEIFAGCSMTFRAYVEADEIEWYANGDLKPFNEGNTVTIVFTEPTSNVETYTVAASNDDGPFKNDKVGGVTFTVSVLPASAPTFIDGGQTTLMDNIMFYVNNPNKWAEGIAIITGVTFAVERALCLMFGLCAIA